MQDPTSIWDAALGQLRLEMNQANFESYLGGTRATAFDDDGLTVAVSTPVIRETLEQRFRPAINRALYDVLGRPCKVRLIIGAKRDARSADGFGMFALPSPPESNQRNGHSLTTDRLFGPSAASFRPPEDHRHNGALGRQAALTRAAETPPSPGAVPAREQGPFTFGPPYRAPLNARYTFERFVVGGSNLLAHAASLAVATSPGQDHNPLFLYGGVGLGKTHLLHAIGHRVVRQGLPVVYVTGEAFTNDFVESIREHRTDGFRGRYRQAGVLMIDDIQFIATKERTQEEFFHTFNAIHEAGGQIVLTSDTAPKAIGTLEERLRSRFEMGLIADIQPPDLETRIAILRSKVNGRGQAPNEVLEVIAHKIQSNVRELEGSLNRVMTYASLHQQELTVDVAMAALQGLMAAPSPTRYGAESILGAVARYYGVELDELRSKKRSQEIVRPRHLAMYLLRQDARLSLPQIGALLGGRDHTSVIHACEKISAEIECDDRARKDARAVRDLLR